MTSELKALLVEGGASHTWVVVADEQEVRAQEWLPALNAVGAAPGTQRSVLAEIAKVVSRSGGVQNALFAVGAACTHAYLGEFAGLMAEVLPESARPPGRTCV